MDQIKWCMKQKKGIELVEPSDNLREAYIIKADEALGVLRSTNIRDWQLTTAYYAIYHSMYSLLMKIGIKCEIHSCTLEFMKFALSSFYPQEDITTINKAFNARSTAQYYIDRIVTKEDSNFIIEKAPFFINKSKEILSKINEEDISLIRKKVEEARNRSSHPKT